MCAQRSTSGSNWFGSTVPEEEHVSKHSLRYRGVANPDLKIGAWSFYICGRGRAMVEVGR